MDAIALGPLLIPLSRLYLILGVVTVFLAARRWERRRQVDLGPALWGMLLAGLLAARFVYVISHWASYRDNPLQALYLWQDGYTPLAGLIAAVLVGGVVAYQRRWQQRVLLLPLLAGLCVWGGLTAVNGALSAQRDLPPLVLEDRTGQPAPLQTFHGQPMVVNLWATWCPPCRREMPVLAQAQQAHPDIHFVFANQREASDTVSAYLREEGLTLDNVLMDGRGELSLYFGAMGMPTTLFFDAHGRMVDSHLGEISAARLQDYLDDF